MLTEEQLKERRKGVTATDVAKIVGQSPFGGPLDVQMDKMGTAPPFTETDRVKWGNLLEEPIRLDYAERHDVYAEDGDFVGTVTHPTEPWAMATPDSIIYSSSRLRDGSGPPSWGHEIKTHTSWLSHLYGEPGTDQVPSWELIQCAWNIWVCSAFYGVALDRWDLTVFLDGLPVDYTIMRDEDLEGALVEVCRGFWADHVLGGKPVPPNGGKHYSEILGSRWPSHVEGKIVEAALSDTVTIKALQEARTAKKAAESEEERLVQEIKLLIGDAESLSWPEIVNDREKTQKINWKRSRDTEKTDWKSLAMEYRGNLEMLYHRSEGGIEGSIVDLDAAQEKHTTTKPGSRRFTVPRSWSST